MSFCTEVKDELTGLKNTKCCEESLSYGILLCGRFFSFKRIGIQTQNRNVAEFFARLMKRSFKAEVQITSGGEKRITYVAEIPSVADRLKILALLNPESEEIINGEMIARECCTGAFVRGAFLACGNISDPEKEYRLDFSFRDEKLAEEFRAILDRHDIKTNISKRGKTYIIYLKKNETIGDLLTLMGASHRSLEVLETAILKSVKNNTNRVSNCDSGNISRTVEASIAQRRAIEHFSKNGSLESLPPELTEAARLRLENPNASLKELCRLSDNPITVSGLNHRLQRIIELYEESRNK